MSNKKREKPYFKNDDGVYECITCGEIREKQSTMCEHTKKHLGSFPFECNICKKGFLQKSCLEVHKKGKHKDKIKNDIEKFKCVFDNCDFESIAKGNRRIHCLRKHFRDEVSKIMGDNNNCSNCNKSFSSQAAFYYHTPTCIQIDDETLNKKLQEIL
jgi:hypothetical protein